MIERFQVAVLGAGFGGLAVAHRLAQSGIDDVVILERDEGVGGTWRANRYPGAACDVPSHLYSLSFAPNPHWSRAFASQPEILDYIEDCYDRFDVRRKVRTGVEITSATWRSDSSTWHLRSADGTSYEASIVVSAIGMFHTPKYPDIPGLDEFGGAVFHSARWNADHDLTDERVAVIGTGASAIQVVPAIVDRVAHLDLYQRSAPWIVRRDDPPYTQDQQREFAEHPDVALRHRQDLHDLLEGSTVFLRGDPIAAAIADQATQFLNEAVTDPALREKLTPRHPFGSTRPLVSSDYYPAVQRDQVDLITDGISRITKSGVVTDDEVERPADTIVLCTGFHAAEYLRGIEVVGRDSVSLHDRWAGLPRAYHGIAVPSFPNLFLMYGPNTNQGGNSILLILEAQAQFIASAVEAMEAADATALEVTESAMDRYAEQLRADMDHTVWVDGFSTYFHNASGDVVTQLPRKAGWYREAVEQIDLDDFTRSSSGVEAEINYIRNPPGPDGDTLRYVTEAEENNTMITQPGRPMRITNGRGLTTDLDREGFVFTRHVSAVADFHKIQEDPDVDQQYVDETAALLEEITGASLVIMMGGGKKRYGESASDRHSALSNAKPARYPHADNTEGSAVVLAELMDTFLDELDLSRYSRYSMLNLWRTFSPPPQDFPLAVCDAQSMSPGDDVTVTAITQERNAGEIVHDTTSYQYNPDHRWYYFPDMTIDEVIIFKSHDSDPSRAPRVAHTAFTDPTCPSGVPTRASVEMRALVLFD